MLFVWKLLFHLQVLFLLGTVPYIILDQKVRMLPSTILVAGTSEACHTGWDHTDPLAGH